MDATAYHESGHVFMAHRLGAVVDSVTVDPDRDDGLARYGDTRVLWRRGRYARDEWQRNLVLVALAGPVAEMIHSGDPLHPGLVAQWSEDWRQAWEAATPLYHAERARLAYLEQICRALHELFSLDHHWSTIAALADNLLAHETLDRESIQEILDA